MEPLKGPLWPRTSFRCLNYREEACSTRPWLVWPCVGAIHLHHAGRRWAPYPAQGYLDSGSGTECSSGDKSYFGPNPNPDLGPLILALALEC